MEVVAVDIGGTHARFAIAEVENGQVGKYADEEYHMYARHGESSSPESPDPQHCADLFDMGIALNRGYADKPEELLQSDSKYAKGHNPMVGADAAANK